MEKSKFQKVFLKLNICKKRKINYLALNLGKIQKKGDPAQLNAFILSVSCAKCAIFNGTYLKE